MPLAQNIFTDVDYEAIAAAVAETARGRWFLAEYSRRNRHADTGMLLAALQRLERVVATTHASAPPDGLRAALTEMARMLERTKSQVAAARPEPGNSRREGAGYEFESVVEGQERATSDVLAAAEQVQDIAWTLREKDLPAEHCEFLEAQAAEIYSACALHELSAQRSRRMVQALRFLEGRIGTLLAMSEGDGAREVPMGVEHSVAVAAAPPSSSRWESFTGAAAAVVAGLAGEGRRVRTAKEERGTRDPLAALRALTREETLALFS